MKSSSFNVLLTSISNKVPMIEAVREACTKIGPDIHVLGGDIDLNCIGRYFVDVFWHMPRLADLTARDIAFYCHQQNIQVIIPSRDGELLFFASIKKELEQQGIAIMVGGQQSVELCLDKLQFSEQLLKMKFPVIPTTLSPDLLNVSAYVVKDRYGAGSRGIAINVSRKEALCHAKTLKNPIFQPYIAGNEYSADVYSDSKGHVHGVTVRTRDVVLHGESQISTTVTHPKIQRLAKKLVQKIQLPGHSIVQLLEDQFGHLHIIELNGRFGGASTLSIASGLDSFYWFFLECLGKDLKKYPFIPTKEILRQIRFPKDIIIKERSFV